MQHKIDPILTVTGPTCSGKTSIVRNLCARYKVAQVVGNTTRAIRPGEVEGVDVNSITEPEFINMKQSGEFFQTLHFHYVYYGTTWEELERIRSIGEIPVMIVDPSGLLCFKEVHKKMGFNHHSVYVDSDTEIMMNRYFNRETPETLAEKPLYHLQRIQGILRELEEWPERFHYSSNIYNRGTHHSYVAALADKIALEIGAVLRN